MSLVTEPDQLAALAGEVASQVGDELRARRPADLAFRQKADAKGEVTALDEWAEDEIVRLLLRQRPDDGVLGEEKNQRASTSGVMWKIDPIDGSVNFIHNYPGWTVVIGGEDHGNPVAAAVYDPMTVAPDGQAGELFVANGRSVTLNSRPVAPSRSVVRSDAVIGIGYDADQRVRSLQGETLARWFSSVRDIRRAGSSVREAIYVCAGRADAFYGYLYSYELCAVLAFANASGIAISVENVHSEAHPDLCRVIAAATQDFHTDFSSTVKSAELESGLIVDGRLAF